MLGASRLRRQERNMNWNQLYPVNRQPDLSAICDYVANPSWHELCSFLETTYSVSPKVEHSTCQGAPGWNIKYKKNGRALCTLYPNDGFFTCLVTIGSKEAKNAEYTIQFCSEPVRNLYRNAKPYNGSRWLMICVSTEETLRDVKRLIALRMEK